MRPWDPAGHGPLTITQENDEVFHRDFQNPSDRCAWRTYIAIVMDLCSITSEGIFCILNILQDALFHPWIVSSSTMT